MNANDPSLKSWIAVPEDSDFPIQNLPFGVFTSEGRSPRVGVAIGDHILDLKDLRQRGYFDSFDLPADVFAQDKLNTFIGTGKRTTSAIREHISLLLRHDNAELRDRREAETVFVSRQEAEMLLPIEVRDYTDFYSSEQHAFNVGSMFRDPENALLPNWKHLPVGYHGRASSIVVSGTPIHRPHGQTKAPDAQSPSFGPSNRLDFELEMAFITCAENGLGNPVPIRNTEDYIFGMVLFNDWSARDIQAWEYVPLGPFLAKNFASSISPWIVTLDALSPYRVAGPVQDPEVLPYLTESGDSNFDIDLQVSLQPQGQAEHVICKSNFSNMYWSIRQQLAHHTVNGCNIGVGDMYASGTISGPDPTSYGSMLELTWKGTKPLTMPDGSERKFVEDYDTVIMRGAADNGVTRIGFGEVVGQVLPAK